MQKIEAGLYVEMEPSERMEIVKPHKRYVGACAIQLPDMGREILEGEEVILIDGRRGVVDSCMVGCRVLKYFVVIDGQMLTVQPDELEPVNDP